MVNGGSLAEDELRPGLEEIAALKHQPGKAIYLVGVSNYGEPYRCRAGG